MINLITPLMSTGLAVGLIIGCLVLGLGLGIALGFFIKFKKSNLSIKQAKEKAEDIVSNANKEASQISEKLISEAKQEANDKRKSLDEEISSRRQSIQAQEQKLDVRDEQLTKRSEALDHREESLSRREEKNDQKREEIEKLAGELETKIEQEDKKLAEIAALSKEQARDIILKETKDGMERELYAYIQQAEEEAKTTANQKAKELLAQACQRLASDVSQETTVTIFDLENNENKGRIIGREGRNIHAFEALTGVDILIDDTPNTIVISGFDPIRREIASRSLTRLIKDGKIHPAKIEEVVEKVQNEVDLMIHEIGEDALFAANCGKMHLDLIKLLGRLNFRTSFGQNVLKHSLEVAFLSGKLAAEIGEDEVIARRAGLLHDIGKAVDHEIEGSHVEIGVEIANRFKEPKEVIDAIASHHGDKEPESIIAVLVAAADALSAARPGARNESLENYIKRLEKLESIATTEKGIEKAYAIQAGREVRVIVKPNEINDKDTFIIARKIKDKIEEEMSYPGTIKVTVIRETRAVETAK